MEPTLEGIEDYNTLKGEKKKVVWAVIALCLLVGIGYTAASKVFNAKNDTIKVKEEIVSNPFGANVIPVK